MVTSLVHGVMTVVPLQCYIYACTHTLVCGNLNLTQENVNTDLKCTLFWNSIIELVSLSLLLEFLSIINDVLCAVQVA